MNTVKVKRTNQLSSFFHPFMNFKKVSCTTAGKTMKVKMKAKQRAVSKPLVALKFFFAFYQKILIVSFDEVLMTESVIWIGATPSSSIVFAIVPILVWLILAESCGINVELLVVEPAGVVSLSRA